MGMEIYYFSGTGNSLVIAREIAEKTGAKLIPIATVIDQPVIKPGADSVGIVFPVYNVDQTGLPLIIPRFIKKLDGIASKYLFAVCTCGGGSVFTIKNLRKVIKAQGGTLAAGFQVVMPQNAFFKAYENKERLYQRSKKKVTAISRYVNERKKGKYESSSIFINMIFVPLIPRLKKLNEQFYRKMTGVTESLTVEQMIPLSDRAFRVDEKCNGCGTCAKVCPVRNIIIQDKKPVWQNHCETCLACYVWCPKEAIDGSIMEGKQYRYRHPAVRASDLMCRSRG